MPCWFFDKRDLKHTPSYRDGVDPETETRYRREGARFILDTGSKMGLRYESSSTGVVYYHRFYMFHSFREFHRYTTAACCLFLAGKVEETPKKCKDIIKVAKQVLTEMGVQSEVFGDDPKEEIITMERVLLQTIKFDLMIEHPYSCLLKFAKVLKGDKTKMGSMVQMAWTFINDSLCTTLCLQWESDIIAVALMYLASRLSKIDFSDWQGKQPGYKGKWYEALVEDISVDLIEDICHQVLDLYSSQNKQKEESPPPPPPPPKPAVNSSGGGHTPTGSKRNRTATPERTTQSGPAAKSSKKEGRARGSHSPSPAADPGEHERHTSRSKSSSRNPSPKHHPAAAPPGPPGSAPPGTVPPPMGGKEATAAGYSQYNPYMSSSMFSSSFMSQEGSQNIRHLLGGGPPAAGGTAAAAPPPNTFGYAQGSAPTQASGYRPPVTSSYPAAAGTNYAQPPPPTGRYTQQTASAYPSTTQYTQPNQYVPAAAPPAAQAYGQYSSQAGYQATYAQPPPGLTGSSYQPPNTAQPPPGYNQQQYSGSQYSSAPGYAPQTNAAAPATQYGSHRSGYATQPSSTSRPQYHSQQAFPNQQGNVPRSGYGSQQGSYQNYQQPPPGVPLRPHGQGMRPRGAPPPPHAPGFPPRPGGPRGGGPLPPRQHTNLTSVPIAGRPGGSGSRYSHH